jgi:hypothetical protein
VRMLNRNFMRLLMGVFSRVCSGVLWGMVVCSVGFWEETLVLFWGRWYREWEEKVPRPREFELCSLHVASSNRPNLCIYVLYYVLYYINSLCSGGFADATTVMCWFGVWLGYGTDVPRTGCARLGSATRRVSFYTSLVGGGLRLSGPSSGSNGSVRVYRRVIFGEQNWREMHANVMILIYIGEYVHKYIGHEIANWWGWGGRRSDHCRRCG